MKYDILDNGGNPYIVEIEKDGYVKIYDNYIFEEEDNDEYFPEKLDPKLVMEINPVKTFIGKSPKTKRTKFSEAYGKEFDGNTILFDIGMYETKSSNIKYSYIFINRNIESFKTKHKIVKYVSPVGGSGVPFPYAIDENGNYYLLSDGENDIMFFNPKDFDYIESPDLDPYEYYYSIRKQHPNKNKIKTIKKKVLFTNFYS